MSQNGKLLNLTTKVMIKWCKCSWKTVKNQPYYLFMSQCMMGTQLL